LRPIQAELIPALSDKSLKRGWGAIGNPRGANSPLLVGRLCDPLPYESVR
jgi:hypothetical protein